MTTGSPTSQRRSIRASRLGTTQPVAPAAVAAQTRADAHAWLNDYEPQAVDAKTWTAVSGFVRDCARALIDEHEVTAEALPRYTRALVKLAAYCRNTHQQLDPRTALDPYTVNQFAAAVATVDAASAGTYQASLRYVGERLSPTPSWERATPVNKRSVAVPYSEPELDALRVQIAKNPDDRRRGGEALMALGLGAGLDGRWSAKVFREDVRQDADGLFVAVAGRVVPVLHAHEDELWRLVQETPAGELVVGGKAAHKNAANEIANRLELDPACPRLNAGRLRSTWIVTHLTLNTRLPELAEAAGTVGITTFSDLLEFVPPLPGRPDQSQRAAREQLRGPR